MKKTILVIAGVLIVILALFINTSGVLLTKGYDIGDYATDFSLPDTEGKMVSLASYPDAKGYILVFTCNTCPYANLYEQRIIDLNNKYQPKGFPVIAINPNDVKAKPEDSMEEMRKRAQKNNYTFPYLRDDSQEVAKKFGATKTPHLYILNSKKNNYKVEYIGAIDDSPRVAEDVEEKYVENALDALLSGQPLVKRKVPAIGCTIKWKNT